MDRVDEITEVVETLPKPLGEPLQLFLGYLAQAPLIDVQSHFVVTFDMKRKACPYLTYWTDGDTRNRGRAILRSWRLFPIPALPRDFGFRIYRGLWRPRCGAGVERDSVWLAC